MFLNSTQQCSEQLREYCTSKENCRRQMMMLALGVSENHPGTLPCCDSCDTSKCPPDLCFESQLSGRSTRRKQRTAVRDVNGDCKATLKNSLSRAVDQYLEKNPSYKMLGRSFVCPDCVIDKICAEARFVQSIDDLNFVGIRPELKSSFYGVVSSVLSNAPDYKRTRRCL